MKKRYNVNLDVEPTEKVQAFLKGSGISFSAFLNGMIRQMARGIQGQPGLFGKNAEDMTIKEFGSLVSYWFRKASGE